MAKSGSSFGRRLRALRTAKGLSQVQLARAIGRHQTTIGPYERDEYTPSHDIIERLASVLDTSPEYLVFGRSPQRRTLTIAGVIAAGGVVRLDEFSPMSMREEQLVGWRLDDDAMLPAYRPGQIVLALAMAERQLPQLVGRDVLAELADGRVLFRRLMPGASAELYDLAASHAPTIAAANVISARLVIGALSAEAFSEFRPLTTS